MAAELTLDDAELRKDGSRQRMPVQPLAQLPADLAQLLGHRIGRGGGPRCRARVDDGRRELAWFWRQVPLNVQSLAHDSQTAEKMTDARQRTSGFVRLVLRSTFLVAARVRARLAAPLLSHAAYSARPAISGS
jgi:hypothetical protein